MIINAQTSQKTAALYHAYLALNLPEQWLLKILAVIYKPVSSGNINRLLRLYQQHFLFEWPEGFISLKPEMKKQLIAEGFISSSHKGMHISPYLAARLTRESLADNHFLTILDRAEQVVPVLNMYEWERTEEDEQRLARDFYFIGNFKHLEKILAFHKNPQTVNHVRNQVLVECCFIEFDLNHFVTLPPDIQYQAFASWFYLIRQHGEPAHFALDLLNNVQRLQPEHELLALLLAEQYLYAGQLTQSAALLAPLKSTCYHLALQASLALMNNQPEQAQQLFSQALAAKQKYGKRKQPHLSGPLGILHTLTLLIRGNTVDASIFEQARAHIEGELQEKKPFDNSLYVAQFLLGTLRSLSHACQYFSHAHTLDFLNEQHPFYAHIVNWLDALSQHWINHQISAPSQVLLMQAIDFFKQAELFLFARLAQQLLATPAIDSQDVDEPLLFNIAGIIEPKHSWDIALEQLLALNPEAIDNVVEKPTRLIWEITLNPYEVSFSAREQKQSASGWSKGRTVSLKRLRENPQQISYLTEQDRALCHAISVAQGWYSNQKEYYLSGAKALLAAKNAPNLYLENALAAPISLSQKEPELLVTQQGSHYILSIANVPSIDDSQSAQPFSIYESAAGHYEFTLFDAQHLKIAKIIGEEGLAIPIAAKDKVLASVNAIAPLLNIHSDLAELDTGLATVLADEHLYINVQPFHEGLEFNCYTMPFGEQGPAFKPSIGSAKITTEINQTRIATTRDLMKEQQQLDQLDTLCPAFLNMHDNQLALPDLQSALEALEQLELTCTDPNSPLAIKLRWPKGKKFHLSKPLQSQHMQLAMTKKNQWFNLNGSLQVNDEKVIELKALLALIDNQQGRFIALDNQQILALSDELKQRLVSLNQATDQGQFHPLASLQVQEAITPMRMKTLDAWDEQTKKMHQANAITPTIPSTLQASLREYQLQGFDWASRLAHWGAGACLADDMGLGKTLQALALLLARAKDGPSLVIAPTSVCFNWQQEAKKFAPTLNLHLFSDTAAGEARQALLSGLGPFDCMIISYGLLQRESELLQQFTWHTIVADEAQALKNPLAKRTQAACALKAPFKIITTGTPIENNLTELWSLFRFINPGLLGNLKRFNQRFSIPIDNAKQDPTAAHKARAGLKTLIKPFMLRRMKHQVLTELPPRTDINLTVTLSEDEHAFYEALRQTAITKLTEASNHSNAAEQRIRMLAELTKLRQACCHPALIMPDTTLTSSKLAALNTLLIELQQNNHKALIFSQFVGHLALIKQHLDAQDISYQYLDGSTPTKERQQRVNAFQRGEGDVFLISLKAGGSGLNLTAADYVIHMDPWWNPAVEEQASDRAHRMGQQRPVTVYRLIAKGTIEEQIVAMHQHKRDLADTLLAGNEMATKLSVDDMLGLLKDTF